MRPFTVSENVLKLTPVEPDPFIAASSKRAAQRAAGAEVPMTAAAPEEPLAGA